MVSSPPASQPLPVVLPNLSQHRLSGLSGSAILSANNSPESSSRGILVSAPNEHQLSEDLALFLANPSSRAALADGSLNLASYSDQVESELQTLERACIDVYRERAADLQAMQEDVHECKSVLAALHEMLLGFQADLGGLSGEIRTLQEKSRLLDVQLKNRKGAKDGLEAFLSKIVVAPNLVDTITGGTVIQPQYLQAVHELQYLYKNCNSTQPEEWSCGIPPVETKAGQELSAQLHLLRVVAVRRIRTSFLQQIASLRRPQTNIRMIQVHGLLKYAPLMEFVSNANTAIADELFNVYVESMSKTLAQLFRTYQAHLLQLDKTTSSATRQDVIAIEDVLLRDTLTTKAKKRVNVLLLGMRASETLDTIVDETCPSDRPILAHVALAENQTYHYERLFRSLLGHLVDAVTNEHVFCRQFFKRDAFGLLFHATLGLLLEQIENYLFACYDALCILLMIKVTHSFKRLARNRKVYSLDPFFDQVTQLLWPRLKTVMDNHLRSVRSATSLKLGGVDLHAHYVSRRYAEFACSLLLILQNTANRQVASTTSAMTKQKTTTLLSGKDGKVGATPKKNTPVSPMRTDEPQSAGDKLMEDITEMMDEFVGLLERLAEELTPQTKRVVFMINNLDLVVTIFQEHRVVGKELNFFAELLMKQREVFVEEELLATGFSKMIAFVQQTESYLTSEPKGGANVNSEVVEALVVEFALHWKSNMDQINRNVLSYFSNFRNGVEILKQVLTQLLLYYTRFHEIIRKVWKNKPPAFCKDLVSTNKILTEIKKYALAI
jgi:hypothetical protein